MNDPDLYVPNKDRFLSPPREKEIPFATRTASRFKCEQTQQRTPPMTFQPQPQIQQQIQPQLPTLSQANPLQAKSRPSFGKQGSGSGLGGGNYVTSDDVQLSADPLRMSRMPELIRVNSSNALSSMERIEQQHEQQQQQSEHFERKSHAHHSIVQKSLVVTKTKQQSKLFL